MSSSSPIRNVQQLSRPVVKCVVTASIAKLPGDGVPDVPGLK